MQRVIPQYLIIVCPKCGLVQYVKEGQKSRKCPNSKCRKVINPQRVIIYAHSSDIHQAVRMVQHIKNTQNEIHEIKDIKSILDEVDND